MLRRLWQVSDVFLQYVIQWLCHYQSLCLQASTVANKCLFFDISKLYTLTIGHAPSTNRLYDTILVVRRHSENILLNHPNL